MMLDVFVFFFFYLLGFGTFEDGGVLLCCG